MKTKEEEEERESPPPQRDRPTYFPDDPREPVMTTPRQGRNRVKLKAQQYDKPSPSPDRWRLRYRNRDSGKVEIRFLGRDDRFVRGYDVISIDQWIGSVDRFGVDVYENDLIERVASELIDPTGSGRFVVKWWRRKNCFTIYDPLLKYFPTAKSGSPYVLMPELIRVVGIWEEGGG